jgi:hypothetical protein
MIIADRDMDRSIVPTQSFTAVRVCLTFVMAALIGGLHVVPIPGAPERSAFQQINHFTAAGVAINSWLITAAIGQIMLLIMPRAKLRWLRCGSYVDPFGIAVLVGAGIIAWMLSSENATSLMTFDSDSNVASGRSYGWAFGALMAGTAAVVACAFVIDRFGLGRGFWIVIAAHAMIMLARTVAVWATDSSPNSIGSTMTAVNCAVLFGTAAMVILMTAHAARSEGGFELVAWPLLLMPVAIFPALLMAMASLGIEPGRKGSPENVPGMTGALIATLAIVVYLMARRDGRTRLFIPLLATLAAVEIAMALLVRPPIDLVIPPATGAFVATLALLTTALQRFRARSANQADRIGRS